jgi:hypothetical protein
VVADVALAAEGLRVEALPMLALPLLALQVVELPAGAVRLAGPVALGALVEAVEPVVEAAVAARIRSSIRRMA